MKVLISVLFLLLLGCEGTHNLGKSGCLPLKVPADLSLLRESGLYTIGNDPSLVLYAHPRDTRYDEFSTLKFVTLVAPGTLLKVGSLKQRWGFDSGLGRISAFGTTPTGEAFEYVWGVGTQISRAPWEHASVPRMRTVHCDQ